MNVVIRISILMSILLTSLNAAADSLQFDNLDKEDVKDIVNDLSGVMAHTSVSSANSIGDVWGFELGLVGGVAATPNLDRLVKEVEPNSEASALPHGGLLGRVSLAGRFTAEALFLPEYETEGSHFQVQSFAAQWTLLKDAPFNLAVKGHMTNLSLSYTQKIDGVDTEVELDNQVLGASVILSQNLMIIEPYVGVGYLQGSGTMDVNGSKSLFNVQYTSSQSASADVSSTHIFGGLEADFLLIKMGAEVGQLYGNTRYSLKLTAGF